jgi:radical SAM superfamily enzyme YgiQ (UPF0313 family)
MRVLLVSTYDLGRQPFGLASPAAWLERAGHELILHDLALDPLEDETIRWADLVAFHLPMHTATRIAASTARRVRLVHPRARLGFYGLYAAMNEPHLRGLGADFVLGGEFEARLVEAVDRLRPSVERGDRSRVTGSSSTLAPSSDDGLEPSDRTPVAISSTVSLERLEFLIPARAGLPALERYAHVHMPDGGIRVTGSTEASRGCKHRCRHCPVVPVYDGRFRVVPREVVLEDVRRQVAAGAQHITFGDPDFWNGIGHAIPIVRALHAEFPSLSYDVTIKIEHLLRHREQLATLAATGCLFVTSAVESLDDRVLARLDKGHTRADFLEVARLFRERDLVLHPTFVAFTPWTTRAAYVDLLETLARLEMVEHVAPIQLAIRLLIPAGSRLLELPEVREWVGEFDPETLVHPWRHPDPEMDALQRRIEELVRGAREAGRRSDLFAAVWDVVRGERCDASSFRRAPVPFLNEPWYC